MQKNEKKNVTRTEQVGIFNNIFDRKHKCGALKRVWALGKCQTTTLRAQTTKNFLVKDKRQLTKNVM